MRVRERVLSLFSLRSSTCTTTTHRTPPRRKPALVREGHHEEGQPPRATTSERRGLWRGWHACAHDTHGGVTRRDQSWPAVPEAKDSRREGSRRVRRVFRRTSPALRSTYLCPSYPFSLFPVGSRVPAVFPRRLHRRATHLNAAGF